MDAAAGRTFHYRAVGKRREPRRQNRGRRKNRPRLGYFPVQNSIFRYFTDEYSPVSGLQSVGTFGAMTANIGFRGILHREVGERASAPPPTRLATLQPG